jgi:SAM-dependent methyltransferases related to tRNA (uracil-5-)-methyltransferase
MTQQQPTQEERRVSYHTVVLGALGRAGYASAEITQPNADGNLETRVLQVPAGLPGEQVTIAIEEPLGPRPGRKRRHWKQRPPRVWITEQQTTSPDRVTAPCPVFGTCGGCQLQHMRYSAQIEWKREVVRQLLHEVGGFTNPPLLDTVACDDPWHYRNHMRFSVNRDGQAGLTARGSHWVLPLEECPIAHEKINRALKIVNQHVNPRPQVLLRCATANEQMLIQPTQSADVIAQFAAAGLQVSSDTMDETLGGHTFRIRPSSFFQTNIAQAEKMAQMVCSGLLADKTPDEAKQLTIVDAYCGVGTFAALLAPQVGKVIAIEESPSAIKDAQWNMRMCEHVEILKGKVEDMLPDVAQQIDGFVIDPPRAGCQQVVLDTLIQHPVKRIIYVSCDPSTLARDLNILCNLHPTYTLRSVQPLDMFPQTAHIETVVCLDKR